MKTTHTNPTKTAYRFPTRVVGEKVSVNGRPGTLEIVDYHLNMWQLTYDDEPGHYHMVAEKSMATA